MVAPTAANIRKAAANQHNRDFIFSPSIFGCCNKLLYQAVQPLEIGRTTYRGHTSPNTASVTASTVPTIHLSTSKSVSMRAQCSGRQIRSSAEGEPRRRRKKVRAQDSKPAPHHRREIIEALTA